MTIELTPIRALIEVARFHPAQALATETHQSFPVPLDAGGPAVAFLYATSRVQPGEGLLLLPPSYRAIILGETGHFRELRSMTPSDFGLTDDPGRVLGAFVLPPDMSPEEYTALKEQLLTAYDAVLPWFFDGVTSPTPTMAQAARDFRAMFDLISEGILRPYYRAIGRRFFTWLDAMAA